MNEALNVSRLEARTAKFKSEMAKKEIVHLKIEIATNSVRERALAKKEAGRAYGKGKKEVAEVMKNRFIQFTGEFGELKKTTSLLVITVSDVVLLVDCTSHKPPTILMRRRWISSLGACVKTLTLIPLFLRSERGLGINGL